MATASGTFVDFYAILEITRDADDEQIKSAIKQQRRTWAKRQGHPDQQRRHEAEVRIQQIAEAERTLLDPNSRQQFDQRLANHRPPSSPTSEASGSWIERTQEFLDRGDAHSANYAAREATNLDGESDLAWALRAQSSLLLGNQRDAVFELQEALRISPNNPSYHFDLGSVYESEGQWGQALESFEKASQLEPDELMYRIAIASAHLQADRPDQALRMLRQLDSQHPGDDSVQFYMANALNDMVFSDLTELSDGSRIITSQEQTDKALELLGQARELSYKDPETRKMIEDNYHLAVEANTVGWQKPLWMGGNPPGWKMGSHARIAFNVAYYYSLPFLSRIAYRAAVGVFVLLAIVGSIGLLVGIFGGSAGGWLTAIFFGGGAVAMVVLGGRKPGWKRNLEQMRADAVAHSL